jgi:hypothetical protein
MFKPLYVSTSTGSSDSTHAHTITDDDHTRTAEEEMAAKRSKGVKVDYIVDICPSLGVAKDGVGMVGVGNNEWVVYRLRRMSILNTCNCTAATSFSCIIAVSRDRTLDGTTRLHS